MRGRIPRSRGRLFADTTPLRAPDFRRLWLAGVVTVIGANLTIFAVPVQLYALTQSSAYVGLSGLFALVPLIVFGLWGGAWADAMDLIAMIFGMPRALFPQMAHESFGGPVEGGLTMALLAAAMSVVAVAGGVFSGWLPRVRRQGVVVVGAIVVWGVAMIGFGLAGGFAHGSAGVFLWIALGCLAIGGAADMVSAAFRSTILQQAASDELRGRLQGVFTVVVAGGPRLADAVHGATAAAAAVGTTVAAAGGGALVVIGMVACTLLVPASSVTA